MNLIKQINEKLSKNVSSTLNRNELHNKVFRTIFVCRVDYEQMFKFIIVTIYPSVHEINQLDWNE